MSPSDTPALEKQLHYCVSLALLLLWLKIKSLMNRGTRVHLQTDPGQRVFISSCSHTAGVVPGRVCLNINKMVCTGRQEVCQPFPGSLALGFANIWLQPLKYAEFKNGASTWSRCRGSDKRVTVLSSSLRDQARFTNPCPLFLIYTITTYRSLKSYLLEPAKVVWQLKCVSLLLETCFQHPHKVAHDCL